MPPEDRPTLSHTMSPFFIFPWVEKEGDGGRGGGRQRGKGGKGGKGRGDRNEGSKGKREDAEEGGRIETGTREAEDEGAGESKNWGKERVQGGCSRREGEGKERRGRREGRSVISSDQECSKSCAGIVNTITITINRTGRGVVISAVRRPSHALTYPVSILYFSLGREGGRCRKRGKGGKGGIEVRLKRGREGREGETGMRGARGRWRERED